MVSLKPNSRPSRKRRFTADLNRVIGAPADRLLLVDGGVAPVEADQIRVARRIRRRRIRRRRRGRQRRILVRRQERRAEIDGVEVDAGVACRSCAARCTRRRARPRTAASSATPTFHCVDAGSLLSYCHTVSDGARLGRQAGRAQVLQLAVAHGDVARERRVVDRAVDGVAPAADRRTGRRRRGRRTAGCP